VIQEQPTGDKVNSKLYLELLKQVLDILLSPEEIHNKQIKIKK